MKQNKKRWLFWLGMMISAVFLYLAFREIEYKELWTALRKIQLVWLVPGLSIYFLGMVLRAWRWQYLLKPLKKVSTATLFPVIMIGYMGNNIFPLRMGEVLRSVVLKRREDISISGSLATIIVERIFDAVVVIGFVLVNLRELTGLSSGRSFSQLSSLATWAVVIFLTGLLIFILIAMFPKPAAHLIHGILHKVLPTKWREAAISFADRFLEGMMSLRSPKDTMMIFLTSVLVWVCETGLYWSLNRALGLGLNIEQLMLLNGVVNLVLLIPAAPGGLGTFDSAGRAMLEAFAIPAETALGYTLVLRIALWVPITLLGILYFLREGLKWTTNIKEIQAQAEQNTPQVER